MTSSSSSSCEKTGGENGKFPPKKVVGRCQTTAWAKKPNRDIVIRVDNGCWGQIMCILPGGNNLTQAVQDWRDLGIKFFISDLPTVLDLNERGVTLRKSEVAPNLLRWHRVRDIFRTDNL